MGLLQILSWRSGKTKSGEPVVEQPQDVRPSQRARSVSERIAEPRITGSNREARLSKASLNQSDEYDMAAPAPLIPTLPLLNMERPGSSSQWSHSSEAFGRFTKMQRPKREPRRPPVSFRKPSSLTSLSRTYRAYDGPETDDAGSFVDNRGRSNSMTSTTSRRSKDILDALEEIKPVEFRYRVLAAGAKDYGEDVADRNLRLSSTASTPNLGRQFNPARGLLISQPNRPGLSSLNSRAKSPICNLSNSPQAMPVTTMREWHEPTLTEAPIDASEPGFFSKRNKNRLSLNTYIPSGLSSSLSPRSAVTTPGLREGTAVKDFGSANAEPANLSRRYHLSPTSSNFSVPRSPRVIRDSAPEQDDSRSEKVDHEDDSVNEERLGDIFTSDNSHRQRRSGSSIGHISLTKTGGRFSSQTFRSSLASSVTSRNPSVDFTPLGYPRLRSSFHADANRLDDYDDSRRTLSLRSHHHSRSNSSEDGFNYRNSRTKSLMSAPSGLRNLLEIDEQNVPDRSGTSHDWNRAVSSNGSTSSSSNIYSGGSGRPASRHTKATSIDSTHQPLSSRKSEDSFLSTSHDQHGTSTSWSPTTTRSTGFNIDDYISSDDEPFPTEKRRGRPAGEGEEELLFKGGYGINGALPGLLEPIDDGACPAPVVRFRRTGFEERQETTQHDEEADDPDDATSEDDRVSVDRDLPVTLLGDVRSSVENGTQGTFGRRSRGSSGQTSKKSVSTTPTGEQGDTSSLGSAKTTTAGNGMYDEMPAPCRNQKRLSALGTLHGRSPDSTNASGDQKATHVPKIQDTIKEENEKVDHSTAIRQRKESKARKRALGAKSSRERRMTRAFGPLEGGGVDATTTQDEANDPERGRPLTRAEDVEGKGKSVAVE